MAIKKRYFREKQMPASWWPRPKSQMFHPLGSMTVCTKCHADPPCRFISVWTKAVEQLPSQQTDFAIPRVMLLAWKKVYDNRAVI